MEAEAAAATAAMAEEAARQSSVKPHMTFPLPKTAVDSLQMNI